MDLFPEERTRRKSKHDCSTLFKNEHTQMTHAGLRAVDSRTTILILTFFVFLGPVVVSFETMQIPYEVRESEFGKGLFAAAFVSEGSLVWEYEKGVNITEYDEQAANAHLAGLTFQECQRFLDLTYGQRGLLCEVLDDGKYMNHSEDPNCKTSTGGNTYAVRDILPGDELFEDYATFDHPDFLYPLLEKYECAPDYYSLVPRRLSANAECEQEEWKSLSSPKSPNFIQSEVLGLEEDAMSATSAVS